MNKQITTNEEGVHAFDLYKGRVKGKFLGPTIEKPNRHLYYIEGKRKTGASTPSGVKFSIDALMNWKSEETAKSLFAVLESGQRIDEEAIVRAAFAADESKQRAADLGTLIHDWCERYIKHRIKVKGYEQMPEMPEDPNVLTGATSFLEWESQHKVKFIWSEKLLYSLKHDYVGRADFAARVDGLLCLCDLKSGNSLHQSVRMQTAAYAMADMEESKVKYDGRWAIRVAKETEKEYLTRMALKDRIKGLLGRKHGYEPDPYQVFEAKFLDNDKKAMKTDFEAFLAAWLLLKWDRANDFWKEKQGVKADE